VDLDRPEARLHCLHDDLSHHQCNCFQTFFSFESYLYNLFSCLVAFGASYVAVGNVKEVVDIRDMEKEIRDNNLRNEECPLVENKCTGVLQGHQGWCDRQ